MTCDCGSPPEHKVWCKVRQERRRRKAASRPPPKQTKAQRRQAEHEELMSRYARTRGLYAAGVRGMGRLGA